MTFFSICGILIVLWKQKRLTQLIKYIKREILKIKDERKMLGLKNISEVISIENN